MQDHRTASDSALVQELTSTRAALRTATGIGEKLQARVDGALVLAHKWAESPDVLALIAVLEGKS